MRFAEAVAALGLEPLDREGGWFRQTWRRPSGLGGDGRPGATAILAAIGGEAFSALHRLGADELWLFHLGDPLEMLLLHPGGGVEAVVLGPDLGAGQRLQHLVPAGTWQGVFARPGPMGGGVVSCVTVPGFSWDDFELGERDALQRGWPGAAAGIARLTRETPAAGAR